MLDVLAVSVSSRDGLTVEGVHQMLEPNTDGASVKRPGTMGGDAIDGGGEMAWAQQLSQALFGGVGGGAEEWEGVAATAWEVESFCSDEDDDLVESVLFS